MNFPPEAKRKGEYTRESDLWAVGVVLWEIFSYGKYYFALPFLSHRGIKYCFYSEYLWFVCKAFYSWHLCCRVFLSLEDRRSNKTVLEYLLVVQSASCTHMEKAIIFWHMFILYNCYVVMILTVKDLIQNMVRIQNGNMQCCWDWKLTIQFISSR